MNTGLLVRSLPAAGRLFVCGLVVSFSSLARAQAPAPNLYKDLENRTYTRGAAEVLESLRYQPDATKLSAPDQFTRDFRLGRWEAIAAALQAMPPEQAPRVYDRMLANLTEREKPYVLLEDVLGLADAAPGDFTTEQLRRLGRLLSAAVPPQETFWMEQALAKGTARLGGTDPAKRLGAGRVLMFGGFNAAARSYLPTLEQARALPDEGLRNELADFLTTQQEIDDLQIKKTEEAFRDLLTLLQEPKTRDKSPAIDNFVRGIERIPQPALLSVVTGLIKTDPVSATRFLGAVGQRYRDYFSKPDFALRTSTLRQMAALANTVAQTVEPRTEPWTALEEVFASLWLEAIETTAKEKPIYDKATPNDKRHVRFVWPDDLLATAPSGPWLKALSPAMADRIEIGLNRVVLLSDDYDRAAERIVDFAQRNPPAGLALAQEFLATWAARNNPELPNWIRSKYNLGEGARIVVTPLMMEKSIQALARVLGLFREKGVAPLDRESLVAAFDAVYGDAEVYRIEHLEKVFGPVAQWEPELFLRLVRRMAENLAGKWRAFQTQTAAGTRRDEEGTLAMVREGYATAQKLVDQWGAAHAESWQAFSMGGALLSDWSDFEYFQELSRRAGTDRTVEAKKHNFEAQALFTRSLEAYGKAVPALKPEQYTVEPYALYFHALLGISGNGEVNLAKPLNQARLVALREAMKALPGPAAAAHLNLFARQVAQQATEADKALPEQLKYKYLAAALTVTQDNPFTAALQRRVGYLDQLLGELRLQTRVDGPNTVGRDQEFGIIFAIQHTAAMSQAANFGRYLSNAKPDGAPTGQPAPKAGFMKVRKLADVQGPRDELELGLRTRLEPFFDIRSITFSAPDVQPRPAGKPGWQETVLAYVLVRAKDASVDRIPPLAMDLSFMDLTGPVTVPAESPETLLQVTGEAVLPRPFTKVDLTETLDTRQLLINGSMALEITANGSGLIPPLETLVDTEALGRQAKIERIDPHEGVQVKALNTWAEGVEPTTTRAWTVYLNGDPIRRKPVPTEFALPTPRVAKVTAAYRGYHDSDMVALERPAIVIGPATGDATRAVGGSSLWWVLLVVLLAVAGAGVAWVLRREGPAVASAALPATVAMPTTVNGFTILGLLKKLRARRPAAEQAELDREIERVQLACFGTPTPTLSPDDLRGIAERWLRA